MERFFAGQSARDARRNFIFVSTATGGMCTAADGVLGRVDLRNAGRICGFIDRVQRAEKTTEIGKGQGVVD